MSRLQHALRLMSAACLAFCAGFAAAAEEPSKPEAAGEIQQSSEAAKKPYVPVEGQAGRDAVWVPTPHVLVEKMRDLAKVTPKDFVMDLGSGDGRNIIAAAKRGVRGLGVEYNPELVEFSRKLAEKELKRSGEFQLPGLVKLVLQKRKARLGRNPATGEEIKIPAKTVVKARIVKQMKDAVLPKA